jgi:hypothetical protein
MDTLRLSLVLPTPCNLSFNSNRYPFNSLGLFYPIHVLHFRSGQVELALQALPLVPGDWLRGSGSG